MLSCEEAGDEKAKVTSKDPGKKVYQIYCTTCHGIDGKLKSGNAADLSISKISSDSIRKVILYGNDKGMGPYKTIIKDEAVIKALVKHVKTLQKN
jgi:mono/diheme cytochrome c family protein